MNIPMASTNIGLLALIKETAKEWMDDDPFRQSAIIAYYSIFSLPALLIIIIWIAGAAYGQQAIQGELSNQINDILGRDTSKAIETMIASAESQDSGVIMKFIGIGILLFGATTVFFHLQKSLNYIWGVEQSPDSNIKKLIIDRGSSLGLILIIGFLLIVSLITSAIITTLTDWLKNNFGTYIIYLAEGINFLLSISIGTLLFAAIFKALPDVKITWSMVWKGAFVTALLFALGKFLLSLYFNLAEPGSPYGAAGSIILILLWVNYSCLILFFGAEFTKVYARRSRIRLKPTKLARWRTKNSEVPIP